MKVLYPDSKIEFYPEKNKKIPEFLPEFKNFEKIVKK